MKTQTRIIFLAVLMAFLNSCEYSARHRGDGNIMVEDRDIEEFTEVTLSGGYEVILRKSNHYALTIEADENLMEYIESYNRGNELEIRNTETIKSSDGIIVRIDYVELNEINVAGAIELTNSNVHEGRRFTLFVSGAGNIDLDLDVDELRLKLSGAGMVQLKGKADEADIDMTGAGSLEAFDLRTNYCNVDISGVGGAEVYVSERLEAEVSGVGGIEYMGNPENVIRDVSGLGRIRGRKTRTDR